MFLFKAIPFLLGWMADRFWGDPPSWPHPVVWFGRAIRAGEKELNTGADRKLKGVLLAVVYIGGTFLATRWLLKSCEGIDYRLSALVTAVGVFYCLAGKTLQDEVKAVFEAVGRSTEEGRNRLSRIVGRDTSSLDANRIRTAALETLSENLSDGVIAPMFWFLLFGLPGMMAYKMVNTLDSMIGYKNERYADFGFFAAKADDIANYIPARLTAFLMLLVGGQTDKLRWVMDNGKNHASPNSGYPEAALAAILDCRFGGPNTYSGVLVDKPYIGSTDRLLTDADMQEALRINNFTEIVMGIIVCCSFIRIF